MIDVAPLERNELQSRLDNAIVLMIRAHVGKPCPTRREIMEWTGIPRRHVWEVLAEVQGRGLIEVEAMGHEPAVRRRMRVAGKAWTDWTARRPVGMVSQRGIKMTALRTAFESKGVTRRDIRLKTAIAEFQNNGGTEDDAIAMVRAAYAKGSEGLRRLAVTGRTSCADASPTHDGEAGQTWIADQANEPVPASPSTPTERGEGLSTPAGKASSAVPSTAFRAPVGQPRGLAAIASVQPTLAKSLFDTTLLPDGRRLRQVRWNECPTLAARYRRLSRILMAVHNQAIPPDPSAPLDTIVSEQQLAEIVETAERVND